MNRIMISGAGGTIGRPLVKYLVNQGFEIIKWNRHEVNISNYHDMEKYITFYKPEVFYHLAAITSWDERERRDSWLVNYHWTSELAWICRIHGIRFIFISSAMVFDIFQQGPFYPDTEPLAQSGYGYEKRKAEEQCLKQNPNTVIVRLGWQINGDGKNCMLYQFDEEQQRKGKVMLSDQFLPSCSFVEDTVRVLTERMNAKPGIYQVNANRGLNLYELGCYLKKIYQKDWQLEKTTEPAQNQLMLDDRIQIEELESALRKRIHFRP